MFGLFKKKKPEAAPQLAKDAICLDTEGKSLTVEFSAAASRGINFEEFIISLTLGTRVRSVNGKQTPEGATMNIQGPAGNPKIDFAKIITEAFSQKPFTVERVEKDGKPAFKIGVDEKTQKEFDALTQKLG